MTDASFPWFRGLGFPSEREIRKAGNANMYPVCTEYSSLLLYRKPRQLWLFSFLSFYNWHFLQFFFFII